LPAKFPLRSAADAVRAANSQPSGQDARVTTISPGVGVVLLNAGAADPLHPTDTLALAKALVEMLDVIERDKAARADFWTHAHDV
jgi:hypothetical protein